MIQGNVMRFAPFILFCLGFVFLAGCKFDPKTPKLQYMPDMADAPTVKSQEDFLDPPDHAVATNAILYPSDMETAEKEFRNPFRPNPKALEEGKLHYETFCTVCHGPDGRGEGTLGKAYPIEVPDITREDLASRKDGFFFMKITQGGPMMPSYGHAIDPRERWNIVLYLRSLQKK